jgi:hypothetical protein
MTHLTLADFEARYRDDPDPWAYESSAYELAKYDATLAACGEGPFARAIELGSSIGVLSERLAPRGTRLVCIDGAATAVEIARRRLAGQAGVQLVCGAIPDAVPDGPYDLVLASEILYYLEPGALAATLARLHEATLPGARVVAVHWRPAGPERPFTADEIHQRLRDESWLDAQRSEATPDYLIDVLRRR